jgi:pilus assembly protein Flp/PilA
MNRAAAYLSAILYVVSERFDGRKERGATAVEYGLMVGLIAVVIIVAVTLLGNNLKDTFNEIAGKV